ncbi:MAG: thermonuclease family protein [Paracoccaceae bacterium]
MAAVAASPHPAGNIIAGKCWVVDGDTIVIGNQNIRLAGIDAPELDQPFGQKAKWALLKLCQGKCVRAEVTGELSYDRLVAICRLEDGTDLAAEMVRSGHAIDWAKHSGGRYRRLEPEGARRRLWRADARQKGRFPPPASQ